MSRRNTGHTVLSSWISAVCQTVRGYGVDPITLAEEAGLDTRLLNVPDARYDVEEVQRFWALAVDATDDPLLGLRVGKEVQAPALHCLGMAMIASGSLARLLELMASYCRIISTSMRMELVHDRKGTTLVLHTLDGTDAMRAACLALITYVYRQACQLSQHPVVPEFVTLVMPYAEDAQRLDAHFKTAVSLGAETDSISFRYGDMIEPYAGANQKLVQVNEQIINAYLSRLRQNDLSNGVLSQIQRMLPAGEPKLCHVAREMNLSPRTLQRRLDNAGCSYRELLDNGRKVLARDLLAHSKTSITEISFLLGFSDPSNFSRASRRWFGCAPQQFRQRLLEVCI
ncbi:AraC family transcriptional regulator ligand-binding domain-containing protein [Cupriavidus campinensis]